MTRSKSLLVLNAGSSSLKFSLFSARPDGIVTTATGVATGRLSLLDARTRSYFSFLERSKKHHVSKDS